MCWMDEMGKMNNIINQSTYRKREHHLPSGISVHRLGTCVPSQAVSVRDQLLLWSSMLCSICIDVFLALIPSVRGGEYAHPFAFRLS